MVHADSGDPHRPGHQEILEEEHAQLNYVDDVLPKCQALWRLCRQTLTKVSSLMGLM